MNNIALIRVPKSGSSTIMHSIGGLDDSRPCVIREHETVDYFNLHGHSHDFITTVRDPLQQYVSCYYYVRNVHNRFVFENPLEPFANPGSLFQHRLVALDTSLNDYLMAAPSNDFAAKFFCGAYPSDFAVIGETNQMDATLAVITAVTGISTTPTWMNKNPARPATLQPYYVDPAVAAAFKIRNAGEYDLYYKGLEHFNALKAKWL